MRIKTLYILFLFCFFYGCSHFKDAENPLILAPKNHQSEAKVCKKPVRKRDEGCGEGFQTKLPEKKERLCLSEVIDLGLRNNPNTRISWAEARQAASIYGQSLSNYFPEFNITVIYEKLRESFFSEDITGDFLATVSQTTINPEMQMNYVLLDFGQRRTASKSALYSLYYANYSHNREIETVMQTIINDYFEYLFQKDLLKSTEANLMSAQASLDAANERKNSGVGSLADVVQAKTEYLQTKISLVGVEVDVNTAYSVLAKDMGIPSNFPFQTDKLPTEVNVDLPLQPLSVLINTAKKNRQDYLAIRANKQSKVFSLQNAQAQQNPALAFNLALGRQYFLSLGTHEDYHYTADLTLSYPLFKGFFYKNLVKQKKAELEVANAQVNQVELDIFEQVTTSHFNVKKAKETYYISKDFLETAKIRFAIAIASYKAGTETILDVLSAQSSLADARAETSRAKKTWFISLANLTYATGTLTKHSLTPEEAL